jgi:alpha-galactosidase
MNRHLTEVGSPAFPAHRQREVAHRYMLGLYRVMETLVTRFPNVLFEGCSGGGGRFDPGLLHYMPQSWTSDNSDAISRLKIQYGTSLVYPLSAMAAHVSAVPNHQHQRVTPLDTRFHVALTGAFGYELDLEAFLPEELDAMKQQIAFFKKHRELLTQGALYRLRDPFQSNEAAWMAVASDRSEALAVHVNIQVEANVLGSLLRLQGLDPDASYEISGITQQCMKGDVLMNIGLLLPAPKGDFTSNCWHLKRSNT